MADLTDTQRTILTAAAARPDLSILPLPDHLKGGAAKKVLAALLARGLAAEASAADSTQPILVATSAALAVVGHTGAEGSENATDGADTPSDAEAARDAAPTVTLEAPATDATVAPTPRRRKGTKQAQLIAMLEAPGGATIAEIADATRWQHHTIRGAIAGALKKRLGMAVTSEKVERRGRIYRIQP